MRGRPHNAFLHVLAETGFGLTAKVLSAVVNDSKKIGEVYDVEPKEVVTLLVRRGLLTADQGKALVADFDTLGATVLTLPSTVDQYTILLPIGRGGLCWVYLGSDPGGQPVAIKVLPSFLAEDNDNVARFYREFEIAHSITHPNVVRTIDKGHFPNSRQPYLVMEYVDGCSVANLLRDSGVLGITLAVHIVRSIAGALNWCISRGVIHRDIKPANILLSKTGLPKLADLGVAKDFTDPRVLTGHRDQLGSPLYMSPEQSINARSADMRSDIYSLGVTFYELLTKHLPFRGESDLEIIEKKTIGLFTPASAVRPDIPPILDMILAKMMAYNSSDRYHTHLELMSDLDRFESLAY